MKRRIDRYTIKWLLKEAGTVKWDLLVLFMIKVVQGVVGVGFAFLLRWIIDAAVSGDFKTFYKGLIYGVAILVMEVVLYWGSIYFRERPSARLSKNLRLKIIKELLKRSYLDVTSVHTGEWMTRINSDAIIIANAIMAIVPGTAGLIVQLSCAFIAMFIVLPRLAWTLIPLAVLMIIISLVLRIKLKGFHKEVQKYEGLSQSYMQESLGSLTIIRAYTKEEYIIKNTENRLEGIVSARLRRARFISWCSSAVYSMVRFSYFLGVAVCGIKLLDGVITYGMMAAVLQLIRQADLPLAEITMAVPQFFNMIASAERLIEIENMEYEYNKDRLSTEETLAFYNQNFDGIELQDISFSYHTQSNQEDVINKLSVSIKKGDCVAFVGESGCGKSTTMKLMMGLFKPDDGTVIIKGNENDSYPIADKWRNMFAYVPQEHFLMSGTIRDIVTFTSQGTSKLDEEIWNALKIACADEFVSELPDQLDTELGEHGSGLSEGQMQRIAIARAVFSEHPILLLDECTSALDEETEKKLLDNIHSLTNRTIVIITHRPAALQICNKQIRF